MAGGLKITSASPERPGRKPRKKKKKRFGHVTG